MPRGEYEPRRGEVSPHEKVREALKTLEAGIDSILTSESFGAYLALMGRLHHYSAGNLALIVAQDPEASMVAGYRRWQSLGRQVRRAEKGIKILVPYPVVVEPEKEDDEEGVYVSSFGVGTVFDVRQTDGRDLPESPRVREIRESTESGQTLYGFLAGYLEREGVGLVRAATQPANGYWQPGTRTIAVGLHVTGDQAVKTLAHEIAHFVADHAFHTPKEDAETVAESAAFVVLSHFGIDASGYTFPYVARWAKDRAVFKRNIDTIQRTAHKIITALEGEEPHDRITE